MSEVKAFGTRTELRYLGLLVKVAQSYIPSREAENKYGLSRVYLADLDSGIALNSDLDGLVKLAADGFLMDHGDIEVPMGTGSIWLQKRVYTLSSAGERVINEALNTYRGLVPRNRG